MPGSLDISSSSFLDPGSSCQAQQIEALSYSSPIAPVILASNGCPGSIRGDVHTMSEPRPAALDSLRRLSALLGLALLSSTLYGAIWTLNLDSYAALSLGLGLCLALATAGALRKRPHYKSSRLATLTLAGLSATAPLLLPRYAELLTAVASATQLQLLALLLGSASSGLLLTPLLARAAPGFLPNASLSLAAMGLGLPPIILFLLPDRSPLSLGLIGLVLLGGSILTTRGPAPATKTKPRWEGSETGIGLGLVLGAGAPLLWMSAAPLYSPTPGWVAQCISGLLLGMVAARALASTLPEQLRRLREGLLPLALLTALQLLLNGPSALSWLHRQLDTSHIDPLLLSGTCSAVAFAIPGMLAGSYGRFSPWAAALGLLAATALTPLLGSDTSLLALVTGLTLLSIPWLLTEVELSARTRRALLPIAALITVALNPGGDGMRLAAPFLDYAEPSQLKASMRAHRARSITLHSSMAGGVITPDTNINLIHYRGQTRQLGPQQLAADAFFGHLPSLLGNSTGRSLLLGAGTGATVDALRRGTTGSVEVYEALPGLRALIRSQGQWNRNVSADPAVRFLKTRPALGAGWELDVLLVDLPPPWLPGAAQLWSKTAIQQIADSLTDNGSAVFRLPLASISGDELSTFTGTVCEQFGAVTAWLNPSGAENLILVGRHQPGPIQAATIFTAWQRRALRDDLAGAALTEPADVLERLLADRQGLLKVSSSRNQRSGLGTAIVAGTRSRRGRQSLPLATLTEASQRTQPAIELAGLESQPRAELEGRLRRAAETRRLYLEMLNSWASGQAGEAMGLATQLASSSASPARDLKAVIAPWLRRGKALQSRQMWEQARSEYLMAASFSPRDIEANLGLADACRMLGEEQRSEQHYQRVLEEDGQHLLASLGLADLRQRQGRAEEAVALLETIENSHPGSFPLLVNLGFGQMQLAQGSDAELEQRLSRARVLFQRAAALEPRRPEARAGLGETYYRMGQLDRALEELDRALLLADSCHYRSWRAHVLFDLGRREQAEKEVQSALLACPELIDALVLLGNIMADQGRYPRAREAWNQVLSKDPDNAAAGANLKQLQLSGVEERKQ